MSWNVLTSFYRNRESVPTTSGAGFLKHFRPHPCWRPRLSGNWMIVSDVPETFGPVQVDPEFFPARVCCRDRSGGTFFPGPGNCSGQPEQRTTLFTSDFQLNRSTQKSCRLFFEHLCRRRPRQRHCRCLRRRLRNQVSNEPVLGLKGPDT